MPFGSNDEALFHRKVNECLEQTRKILHHEKGLTTLDKVAHKYVDKYRIADYMGMSAIACYLNCLSTLGLSSGDLLKLASWSQCLDVTLCLKVQKECVFVKEATHEVESASRFQTETTGVVGFSLTTSKVITTVTEYFYLFAARYELFAYRGVEDSPADRIVLQSRSSEQEIVTTSETSPYAGATENHFDLNISWLLRRIDLQISRANFSIDRNRNDCHTPTHNQDIAAALAFFTTCGEWCHNVMRAKDELLKVQQKFSQNHFKQDLTVIGSHGIFLPVLPLVSDNEYSVYGSMSNLKSESESKRIGDEELLVLGDISLTRTEPVERGVNSITNSESPVILTDALINQLLSEQARSLQVKLDSLIPLFPPSTSKAIITVAEAKTLVILSYMKDVVLNLTLGIAYIDNMLRDQLVAAVGKTLQPSDFAAYMRYHNRKLFKDEFQPRPFSHAVRRTAQHSPEGSIRIEEQAGGAMSEPIYTACCSRSASSTAPMQFALNASTNVTFGGDRHLHTYLAHSFSGQQLPKLTLVAQARQFSSFIVLVGSIVSAQVFEPKYGMIVQNKDEITIPLDLEQIPTPKQFRDAIESLSPEQQRFAKAFRGMQLESTLFGVLVLQIKPQLEIVLKLSTDTLTKEIKLTQELMMMFIEYQIPSDLLSFDEVSSSANASSLDRLNAVKLHVHGMRGMLSLSKDEEIKEQQSKRDFNLGVKPSVGCGFGQPFGQAITFGGVDSAVFGGSGGRSTAASTGFGAPIVGAFGHPSTPYGLHQLPPTNLSGNMLGAVSNSQAFGSPGGTAKTPDPPSREGIAVKEGDRITPIKRPTAANQNKANNSVSKAAEGLTDGGIVDYTKFPGLLETKYEELDSDSVLRPTIIHPGAQWTKKSFASLLTEADTKALKYDDQVLEKNAAFDLLDALSKSGALVMHSASLHVVIAATHCFDKSLMDTVVLGNVNPIERVERSALIMASTIHELPACDLIAENQRSRVLTYSPQLDDEI
jgi:hypothetical protein